jgi:endonuclease/exonuclease/phosphatase family metal-dependent hydrolase
MKTVKRLLFIILILFAYQTSYGAFDTLKVMNWNILNFGGTDTSRVQYYRTVIGSASPDIFVCQEITGPAANKVLFNQVFQAFAPGAYDTCTFHQGPDTGNLLIFKKSKASFIHLDSIVTELRLVSIFKMYIPYIQDTVRFLSCHLKASSGSTNEAQRGREVDSIRKYTNSLPSGKFFMLMGDYNLYSANEVAYTKLMAAGGIDGRFYDPINGMTGNWNGVSAYAPYFTQSPRIRSFGGGAAGGMDDRFDLIINSRACTDTTSGKFYWVRSKYTAYGNDGNHFNDSINKLPNTAVSVAVANGIHYASDHIPVIAYFAMNNSSLPVNLASFVSSVTGNNIELKWSTESELNNSGFEIERKANSDWKKIGFVAGSGNTNSVNSYSYTDRGLQSGSYQYRLKQIDFNGNYEYHNLTNEVTIGAPDKFTLEQNYPNPFNPSTTINYSLTNDGFVSLTVYDMLGREVTSLVQEFKPAGYYSIDFNASALTSGMYFYRLSANGFTSIRKMTLIK